MALKQLIKEINVTEYTPHSSLLSQKSASKYLDGTQIFLGKDLVVGNHKKEKALFTNYNKIKLSLSFRI